MRAPGEKSPSPFALRPRESSGGTSTPVAVGDAALPTARDERFAPAIVADQRGAAHRRRAQRGRSAMEGGDARAGAKRLSVRAPVWLTAAPTQRSTPQRPRRMTRPRTRTLVNDIPADWEGVPRGTSRGGRAARALNQRLASASGRLRRRSSANAPQRAGVSRWMWRCAVGDINNDGWPDLPWEW